MDTLWTLETHGDPLGAVRGLMQAVWSQSSLDGMLVPLNGDGHILTKPRLLENPAQLEEVNPFKPLMMENASRQVPRLRAERPNARLGALLRPCEMRALIEMVKHDSFDLDGFLTVSVDCLGTFPADEYEWRAARKESNDSLTRETIQFVKQGGILAYRYRSACQMCVSPEASSADLNINVLGLPARQHILVRARDEATAERLKLDAITDGVAEPHSISQHERVLARMTERLNRTMERVTQGLGELLPQNVDAIIEQLESCGDCQGCMQACPICAVDFPDRDQDGHYRPEDVKRWLVSCAGCGMCEQACPTHLPLSTIFRHIREKLSAELGYVPGLSLDEPLPAI
jgi:formate dehydrogenase subunit beta